MKVLGPTFPNLGIQQREWEPPGTLTWRPVGFYYRTSTGLGKQALGGYNKSFSTSPRRKDEWPQQRLSQTCLRVSRNLRHRPRLTVGCHGVRGTEYNSPGLALGQTTGREHSPTHQWKIGLKIYWAWPCLSKQDPDCPTVSPSPQEASISLLSLSIRGQTEWKPQSQKTSQSDHLNHSLV